MRQALVLLSLCLLGGCAGSVAEHRPDGDAASCVSLAAHDPEELNAATVRSIRAFVSARHSGGGPGYDVLIVPGFTPLGVRQPTPLTQIPAARRRLDLAVQDFRAGAAPYLIVTGGSVHPSGTPCNEALMMREYLVHTGVPADRILVEPFARHSTTNLRNAGHLMMELGLSAALIVTGFERPIFDQAFYFGHPRLSTFAARCERELGYQVGRLKRIDAHHIAFRPAPAVPRNGWRAQAAPHGRILPLDLSLVNEDALLLSGGRAAVYALGTSPADFHPERQPLLLVHGLGGDPVDLQPVVQRLAGRSFQLYAVVYNDLHRRTSENGKDLADELRRLEARTVGPGQDLIIVAHSMGGIVARWALNELALGAQHGLERYGAVRLVAIDTPWHGYPGPSDHGAGGVMMALSRPFLPDGLEDMRARSDMFQGDPGARDAAGKAGLLRVVLPINVSIDLVFSERGGVVLHDGEGVLSQLAGKLVRYFRDDEPIRGDARVVNYWLALISSQRYLAFREAMEELADRGRLDEAAARRLLRRYYPRFPGDHMGVLGDHPGRFGLLEYLAATLEPGRSANALHSFRRKRSPAIILPSI